MAHRPSMLTSEQSKVLNRDVFRAIGAAANVQADPGVNPATGRIEGPLSVFASSAVPQCTLEHYAAYVAKNVHQKEAVLLGAVLLLRIWRTTGAAPTPKTVHRLLLGCVSVAMKAHYDDFYVTKYMARIGSVPTRELGVLESRVTELLEWTVQVRHHELSFFADELARLGGRASAVGDASTGRLVEAFVQRTEAARPMDRIERVEARGGAVGATLATFAADLSGSLPPISSGAGASTLGVPTGVRGKDRLGRSDLNESSSSGVYLANGASMSISAA